ncbi:MAG: cupin domain-containing protein [Methylophilus sp.]|nr:cupin domain-containing protein [Methylophilus sp.]
MNLLPSPYFVSALASLMVLFSMPYAFALDESNAVQVVTVLKTQTSWDGKPIEYPTGKPEVTGMLVEIAPGAETGWHSHAVPSFGMIIEGELEVQLKNGDTKRLKSGDALAEVVNVLHNGKNVGAVPVRLVVFYAGTVGQKLSEREKQ